MALEHGIAVTIKAFVTTGKDIARSHRILGLVHEAMTVNTTEAWSNVLAEGTIETAEAEPRTRRGATVQTPVEPGPLVGMMEGQEQGVAQIFELKQEAAE